jgi:hypothetical protein
MKKRKPPRLVVDNKLPDEPSEEFTHEEFKVYAEQIIDLHKRYPELDEIVRRAHKTKDTAMSMALLDLNMQYAFWRDIVAEDNRNELQVVKRKRDL